MGTESQLKPGDRVCFYGRDSGGDRQEQSIAQQLEVVSRFCKDNGFLLTRVFSDQARSGGKSANRDEFLRMVDYLADKEVPERGLVLWNYDRFARDFEAHSYYISMIRMAGKRVISITDNVPDTLDGRVFESLLAWKNAKYRIDLGNNVRRAMIRDVYRYKATMNGSTPVGYRRVQMNVGEHRDGQPHLVSRLEPDPLVAPKIKRAFELRALGFSHREIDREVHLFTYLSSYSDLFRNPVYIGRMRWGDVEIENFYEPVVDLATWEQVQRSTKESESRRGIWHPRTQSSPFLLAGLLQCGKCGARMTGQVTNVVRGKAYTYYRCGSRDNGNSCGMKRISTERLDQLVMRALQDLLTSSEVLQDLYNTVQDKASHAQEEAQAEEAQIKRELGALEARIRRITQAIAEHGHSRAMLEELARLEGEQDQLRIKLDELSMSPAYPVNFPPNVDIIEFGREAWRAVQEADPRKRQLLVRSMVSEVRALRDGTNIDGTLTIKELPLIGRVNKVLPLDV